MSKKHDPKLRHQARVLALQALYQWQMHDDLAPSELKKHLPTQDEAPEYDIDYFEQLITETPGYSAGLDQQLGETGWQLSHGEKSRVFLARALIQDADLILLDETFGALDPVTMKLCVDAATERAKALLVIAHP